MIPTHTCVPVIYYEHIPASQSFFRNATPPLTPSSDGRCFIPGSSPRPLSHGFPSLVLRFQPIIRLYPPPSSPPTHARTDYGSRSCAHPTCPTFFDQRPSSIRYAENAKPHPLIRLHTHEQILTGTPKMHVPRDGMGDHPFQLNRNLYAQHDLVLNHPQ